MSEDVKARIIIPIAEPLRNLKELQKGFEGVGDKAIIAGAGAGNFGQELRSLVPIAAGVGIGVAAIAAAATATGLALFNLTKGVAAVGDELAKTSRSQGIAIETLSELQFAADRSGIPLEGLVVGFRNLNIAIADAIAGKTGEAPDILRQTGVELQNLDLSARDSSEVLMDLADTFATMKDGAEKTALAAQIFGRRSGPDMIPLLNEGRRGIEALQERLHFLGGVYDKDLGEASERFVDAQTDVRTALQGVRNSIARELLPAFSDVVEDTADWIATNRELLRQPIQIFAQGMASAARNLAQSFGLLIPSVDDTTTAFSSLGGVMLSANEAILLSVKGFGALVALQKTSLQVAKYNPLDPLFMSGEVDKQIDKTDGKIREIQGIINEIEERNRGLARGILFPESVQQEQDAAKRANDEYEQSLKDIAEAQNALDVALGKKVRALGEEDKKLQDNIKARQEHLRTLGLEGEALIQVEAQMLREKGRNEEVIQQYIEIRRQEEARTQALRSRTAASKDADKTEQDLIKTREQYAKSLAEETAQLEAQIFLFGASADTIIDYEAETMKAKVATEALTDAFDPQIDKIAELKKEFSDLQLKESLEEDIVAIKRDSLSELELAFLEFGERVAKIGQGVLENVLSPEEADRLVRIQKERLEKNVAEINRATIEAERASYIERLKLSDSFFDNLKGGYLEFAYAVETNGELVSQFFANTLTSMSQSFSDLFYNVLTGRFDDLKDLAKQTFEAILRAFLDMVSAIATRQIVISIAGAFGVNTQGFAAEDVLGFGTQAVDAFGGGGSAAPSPAPYNPGEAVDVGGQIYTQGPDGTMVPMDANGAPQAPSQIGQGIGAGILGISIGSAIGGMINSDMSGFEQGISLGLGAAGAVGGFLIAGPIGAAVGGFIGSLIVPIFSSIFKKTPRLDIDFDSIKTDLGRRAATIEELLDDDFFADNIGQVSVKRKAGLGVGGDEKILELIQDRIEDTIEGIQDIIGRLPSDMFEILNQTLLDAELDIDTVIGGERLLEFDAKGKKIGEKFQAFIEGELPAKVFAGIRESFFDPAFQALGVSADATQDMIDQFLADMEAAGSREARAAVGQEFIEKFSAFVDAFNIVEGNFGDAIGQTINSVETLSRELGFNAVPSIDEMTEALKVMIENGEIDPEVIQGFVDLRTQLIQVKSALTDTISGLVDFINQLNTKIVGLGGSAVDVGYAIDEAIASIMETLSQEGLSLEEREALLRQLDGLVDQWVEGQTAAQQAVAQEQQAAAQAEAKARQEAITGQISALEREKQMIAEVGQERLAALNEELQVTQNLFSIAENIGKNIQDLLLGSSGVESPFQRLQRAQSDLDSLQARFASSTGEERGALAQDIQGLLNTVLDIGGEAFDNTSPEFRDTFRQVINELGSLKDQVEPTKSIEQINQEIADLTKVNEANLRSIDDRMEALRAQAQAAAQEASAIGQQAFQLDEETAAEARAYYEYIQQEAQANLDARLAQLAELGIDTNGALSAGEAIAAEQLVTLRDIHAALVSGLEGNGQTNIANVVNPTTGTVETSSGPVNYNPFSPFSVIPAATGFEGIVKKAQLFLAGEAGEEHVSITPVKDLAERARANQSHISDLFDSITSGMGNTINDFADEVLSSQTRISDFADRVLGSQTHISDMVDRLGGHIDVVPGMNLSLSVDLRGSTFDSAERVSEVEGVLDRFGQKLERRIKDSVFKEMRHDMRTRRYLKLK